MSIFSSFNFYTDNHGLVAWDKINEEIFGYDRAKQINETCKDLVAKGNHDELINVENIGKETQLAVPTTEHYLPHLYFGIKR